MATAKTATRAKNAPPTMGEMIDKMAETRDKKRVLESSIKELDGVIADLESQIMESMAAQGVDKMTGKLASVSITTNTVAQVEDWDAFLAYVYKMKFGHLLQRRVSDPAYRELLEQGKKVPGVQPFSKARLNLRSL